MSSPLPVNKFRPVHREMPDANAMDKKMREVAELYEKQFLRMMTKEMRQTVHPTEDPSMTEKIFQEKMDDEYVEKWGERGGIGLADIIHSQLRERFAPQLQQMQRPQGPLPLNKGSMIHVDDTKEFQPIGIDPEVKPEQNPDMSFRMKAAPGGADSREVKAPWDGEVTKVVNTDSQNHVQIKHDHGLVSNMNFEGRMNQIKVGDRVSAGELMGSVSPDNPSLNWRLVEVET